MKKIIIYIQIALVSLLTGACDDFLDREPLSSIAPEQYLNDEAQLAAYLNGLYPAVLFSHTSNTDGNWYGTFGMDTHTDNMAALGFSGIFAPGYVRVGADGGAWDFGAIRSCNYFLNRALPDWKAGKITGGPENIRHYIGEMYFLRAEIYFSKLKELGDFPIIRHTLPDDMQALTEASKRAPRNEVARFILADLDSAILLMKDVAPGNMKTRLNKHCAWLLKSRAALYEGTWLKYFKGTAFVPNGPGWPGKAKDYNGDYHYPSGSIDSEINFFLETAMSAAQIVADQVMLTPNTKLLRQAEAEPKNPYFDMFGDTDMSGYSEALLWRQYSKSLGVTHGVPIAVSRGGHSCGITRGLVDAFLMENGLPIYASNSFYAGDNYIADVRKNRDNRLFLFLKEPGQKNVLFSSDPSVASYLTVDELYPRIKENNTDGYNTGYAFRKGGNFDNAQGGNHQCFTGSLIYRAAEAYLNYMEACYERYGALNAAAQNYWVQIRDRAGVSTDFQKTINNTVVAREALNDWGAYSAGNQVDATLYNIRRERRCELVGEGMLRSADIRRWRALDQLIETPYHIEGFKLWGPMAGWYTGLTYGESNPNSLVSSPTRSDYLRPYEKSAISLVYEGYRWHMAHYLSPIAYDHFLITSGSGGNVANSPVYQNPGWPVTANGVPEGVVVE
ncbi:MAG: RagB/SusD family nutrient uptake outer membrane protein [Bacteroidales bacterium]|jgi:hypothetical protein|nr:RagB/SusD family nutrient uptake outer membrane protein [Bacteroidales bacterium]